MNIQFADAVHELYKAAINDSSEVSVSPTAKNGATTYLQWYSMRRPGKMEVIEYFGLPERFVGIDTNLPQWVHESELNVLSGSINFLYKRLLFRLR